MQWKQQNGVVEFFNSGQQKNAEFLSDICVISKAMCLPPIFSDERRRPLGKFRSICVVAMIAVVLSVAAAPAIPSRAAPNVTQSVASRLLQTINDFNTSPFSYQRRVGPYAPIGRLEVPMTAADPRNPVGKAGTSYATAFLISPCYIYTARHNVFGGLMSPSAADGHSVKFSAGQGPGQSFRYNRVNATPVVWSRLRDDEGRDIEGAGQSSDFEMTVMRLERCVGEDPEIGWAQLRPGETNVPGGSEERNDLQIAGYPAERDLNQLSVAGNCGAKGETRDGKGRGEVRLGGFYHNCSARKGMSGAPIFFVVAGVPRVVGAHNEEHRRINEPGPVLVRPEYSLEYANVANPMASQSEEIWDLTRADICRFGRPNPLDQSSGSRRSLERCPSPVAQRQ